MMNSAEFANIARAERTFWWYRGMRRILFRALKPFLTGRTIRNALEAGCGTGYFARLLEAERRWSVFPVDLAWEGLQYGCAWGVRRLCQADLSALPFPARAFDIVTSMDVIGCFQRGDEHRPLRELCRVLAPNGLLVLRAAALDLLRSRHSWFVCERQRFTRSRLKQVVQGCGIRVLRCTYANSLLLPAALVKFRLYEPLLRRRPASGVTPVPGWLDSLLYVPLALESAWIGSGLDSPLGQSLILIGEKAAW